MKKNKMMRAASILLVAVLLTTSIISGTFAKYVTSGEAEDQARVAKFGVEVTATGALFAENYYSVISGASNLPGAVDNDDNDIALLTVESSNGDNVVAPGTKSSANGITFTITGTPEVDVKINFSIEEGFKEVFLGASQVMPDRTTARGDDIFDGEEIYYPIVFTLRDRNGNALASGTLEDIQDHLDGDDGALYVEANTDINNSALGVLTLTWEWPFDETAAQDLEDALGETYSGNNLADVDDRDKKDTLLGDLAAGTALSDFWGQPIKNPTNPEGTGDEGDGRLPVADVDYSLNTNVKIAVTVTQVD